MEHQGQRQHQKKQKGVGKTEDPLPEIAAGRLPAVYRVQTGHQAVNAPAGRPQSRNRGQSQHHTGGIAPGTAHQPFRSWHQRFRQHRCQNPQKAFHRQGRTAQRAEKQQQRGKQGQHHEVTGIGRVEGNSQRSKGAE